MTILRRERRRRLRSPRFWEDQSGVIGDVVSPRGIVRRIDVAGLAMTPGVHRVW